MKKAFVLLALSIICIVDKAHCQALYPTPAEEIRIIKVQPMLDTQFIRVYTRFKLTKTGEQKDMYILKIECSVCDDSLIAVAKADATKYVRGLKLPVGKQNDEAVDIYFTQPVTFWYPNKFRW